MHLMIQSSLKAVKRSRLMFRNCWKSGPKHPLLSNAACLNIRTDFHCPGVIVYIEYLKTDISDDNSKIVVWSLFIVLVRKYYWFSFKHFIQCSFSNKYNVERKLNTME